MTDLSQSITDENPTETTSKNRQQGWLQALLLVIVTLAVYLPALRCGYIWDDDYYVTNNDTLHDWDGLVRIWTEPGAVPQYYPMVHTVFWVQYQLFKLNPVSYHAVNIACHILVSLLWWRVLRRLSIPGSYLAAMIFALHPVHVESVVWVTELKNVLSGVFYLLAAWAYLHFAGVRPDRGDMTTVDEPVTSRRWFWYALVILCFIAALLSKTVVCTLPAALVLVMWWKRKRFPWADLAWLVPLLIMGIVMGLHTAAMEKNHVGAEGADWAFGMTDRLLIAGRVVWFYAAKLLWPAKLVFFYDYWHIDPTQGWQWLFPIGFVAVVYALLRNRKFISGKPLVAILFFVGTLFPALGFVNVFPMRYAFVADHFQYLASMGIIALFAGVIWYAMRHIPRYRILLCVFIIAALGGRTLNYIPVYTNQVTLWEHVIANNKAPWMALNNLGSIYQGRGDSQKAMPYFKQAIVHRHEWTAYNNLGVAYRNLGDSHTSANLLKRGIQITGNARLYVPLARTYEKRGNLDKAIKHLQTAMHLRPDDQKIQFELSALFYNQKQFAQSQQILEQLVQKSPDKPNVWLTLGKVYERTDQWDRAAECYDTGLAHVMQTASESDIAKLRIGLGKAYIKTQRPELAINVLEQVRLTPQANRQVYELLAKLHVSQGNWRLAHTLYASLKQQEPKDTKTRWDNRLALCLLKDPQSNAQDWQLARKLMDAYIQAKWPKTSLSDWQIYATSCEATGDFAKAIDILKQTLRDYASDPQLTAEARSQIDKQLQRCQSQLTDE